jgi:hypothetical protein
MTSLVRKKKIAAQQATTYAANRNIPNCAAQQLERQQE